MCTSALWPTQTSQSQKTATNWQHTPGWYFSPTHDTSRHIFHTDPSPRHFIYPYRVLAGGRHTKPYWRLPGDGSSFKPPWTQTFLLVLRSGRRSSWSRVIKKFTIKQEIRQHAGVQYSNRYSQNLTTFHDLTPIAQHVCSGSFPNHVTKLCFLLIYCYVIYKT